MTTTQAPALADLLSAKRAAIDSAPSNEEEKAITPSEVGEAGDVMYSGPEGTGWVKPDVTEHGEIVPAGPPPQPVEYAPQYPSIPPKVVGGLPYVRDYMKLARTIHSTEMVPVAFQGRPDAILACFLRGYELGFGPMQALDSFNVIQGKVGLTAEAMRALIMDNGHHIILEDVYDSDGKLFGIEADCHRNDWPSQKWTKYRYTIDDAKLASLVEWHERWTKNANGKSFKQTWNPFGEDPKPDWVNASNRKTGDNWKKMPRAMLDARCTSGAGRRHFADVLAGMSYTPEEIRDFTNDKEMEPSPAPVTTQSPAPEVLNGGNAPKPSVTPPETPTSESSTPSEDASQTPTLQPEPPKKAAHAKKEAKPKEDAPVPSENGTGSEPSLSERDAPSTEPSSGSDVKLEMRKALTALIAGLEPLQQPMVRAFLAQQGYGDISKLDEAKIQEAINIAAGWPDTMVVDAEVVEDLDQTREDLVNEFEQQAF
jgi:hypothetical protein